MIAGRKGRGSDARRPKMEKKNESASNTGWKTLQEHNFLERGERVETETTRKITWDTRRLTSPTDFNNTITKI